MALGTITFDDEQDSQGPTFITKLHFAGDAAYPANGTTGLLAALRAKYGDNRTIIGIIPQDCGGYMPTYDVASDKLKVYFGDNNNAADGPLIETTITDLHLITFNLLVLSY